MEELHVIKFISKDVNQQKREEKKKQQLLELNKKYSSYIKIVDDISKELFGKIDTNSNRLNYEVKLEDDLNYLNRFEKYLEDVSINFILGPPDSFIIASCLMFALIDSKRVSFKVNEETPDQILKVNYNIAIGVALNLISAPLVYKQDEKGNFTPSQLSFVEITFPNFNVKFEPLPVRFINTLMLNDIYGNKNDPLLFSLLLQMVYFDCLNKQQEMN